MRAIVIVLSILIFNNNYALEITCEADPRAEHAFPESPIVIKLQEDGDSFVVEDDEQMRLKHSQEDRLKWKWYMPFMDVELDIDVRNQQTVFYDDEGRPALTIPMICKNGPEAEQEFNNQLLVNQINLSGKLAAAGYPSDLFVDDSPRHIQGKTMLDPLDFARPPKDNALQR